MSTTESHAPFIVVMGTLDTKGPELTFLAERVRAHGCKPVLMDVSAGYSAFDGADVTTADVTASVGQDVTAINQRPRGEAVALVCEGAAVTLQRMMADGMLQGVIGVGGSGGTTICTAAMRTLPYGVPKVMISTLASGNTRWHVDISDIVMMPSLLDIGGLNPMLEMVLNNGAAAICGMVVGHQPFQPSEKPVVVLTMYGTTTPGVSGARRYVDAQDYETWVFHASGVGGRTMERLMEMGRINAVMDMTLAEIGAHLVGGLHDAGAERLSMAGALGLPQLIVPGACDTVVLPPRDQVPERFNGRTLNFHNPTMTTLRTNAAENEAIAHFIAAKLNQSSGPVTVALPLGGLSSIDRPGKIFFAPEVNAVLFEVLKAELSPAVKVVESPHHIDDPEFAALAGQLMLELLDN